ncbi:ABC transporter permease [Kibdelosporangium persicum]|uniref:Integral membrane components of other binding-protein-dependent transport system n=1 Tax=Kibdelosporangium persicum TaxID=2698649 RepID=A0ABX2F3L3_9PSEU|nr:ABC transporter permease [Kibdelosporangium persicum]NRN65929.1 Integral membrane components of other binding-protein-dependent transport system [Kibdelosporangium persicum]
MKPAGVKPGPGEEQAAGRFLEAERASRGPGSASARQDRKDWTALPRRGAAKPPSSLLSIRKPISRKAQLTLTVLSFVIPLLAWVVLSATQVVSPTFLPGPVATLQAGWEMAQSGQLFTDLWDTLRRIVYGFGLAVLVSVPVGIAMGTFMAGRALFEPFLSMVRYLPASAFIPLMMIWLGIDEESKIGVLFLGTVFFNTFMTADVVRSVPAQLINVSYTLGARRDEVLRKVIMPHSLPGIIDAIRVNIAAAWNLVVVAEVVVSTTGLGRRIMQSQRFLETDQIFAILIVIGICGVVIDMLLRLLRNRIGRWAT